MARAAVELDKLQRMKSAPGKLEAAGTNKAAAKPRRCPPSLAQVCGGYISVNALCFYTFLSDNCQNLSILAVMRAHVLR